MRRATPIPILGMSLAALAAGAAIWAGLALAGKPPRMEERVEALGGLAARAAAIEARPGQAGRWKAGTVCPGADDPAVRTYASRIRAKAESGRVMLSEAAIGKDEPVREGGLVSISVQLKGVGAYPDVVLLLSGLAAETPVLFVQTLDIRQTRDISEFTLKGTMRCWA